MTEPVLKTVERNGLGSSNLPPSAIAFVRVPKTGSSSILYETVPEICPGVIDFSYNGSCFINHESNHISVNNIIKKYCNFPKFNQHVSVSVYKNLHTHNHFFYTQVRDPYDIACSLYFFLKKLGYGSRIMGSNVDTDFYNSQLILRGASINDYLENMRPNATFTHYYDELDIKNFDCVGFTNSLGKTSMILNKMFNLNIGPHVKNVNPRKELGEFYNFKFSRRQFKKLNEQEYKIFYDGLQKFESLCKTYVY